MKDVYEEMVKQLREPLDVIERKIVGHLRERDHNYFVIGSLSLEFKYNLSIMKTIIDVMCEHGVVRRVPSDENLAHGFSSECDVFALKNA